MLHATCLVYSTLKFLTAVAETSYLLDSSLHDSVARYKANMDQFLLPGVTERDVRAN